MEKENLPKTLGQRCRAARKMKGMTQNELAMKINMTSQNISKLEKEGIRDVVTEMSISEALGCSLREDAIDKEGTVGEIGKEILSCLLKHQGKISLKELEQDYMYGMGSEIVKKEIQKLAELWMCINESYVNFEGNLTDDVFITAKGLMTYKNIISDKFHVEQLNELLPYVKTYEQRLKPAEWEIGIKEASDMEEYVELRPWEKHIHDLEFTSPYRADFITFLKSKRVHCPKSVGLDWFQAQFVFPGKSCYYDILYRMVFNLTDKWREQYYFIPTYNKELEEHYLLMQGDGSLIDENEDPCNQIIRRNLRKEMPWLDDSKTELMKRRITEVQKNDENEKRKLDEMFTELLGFVEEREHLYWEAKPQGKDSDFFYEWYEKEEIEAFIRENYKAPATEEEQQIQTKLNQIINECPYLDEYFRFPETWEENGLADLLRNIFGINKTEDK